MSHIAKIQIEIKDLSALRAACEALGLELIEGQKTYKWWGTTHGVPREGHDLPVGFTIDDLGKCEHAIRVKGNAKAYEIGVARARDGRGGFVLLADLFSPPLRAAVGDGAGRLRQEYSAAVAVNHYRRQGYRVAREVKADGKIVLRATR